jgi:hypothetical protein
MSIGATYAERNPGSNGENDAVLAAACRTFGRIIVFFPGRSSNHEASDHV